MHKRVVGSDAYFLVVGEAVGCNENNSGAAALSLHLWGLEPSFPPVPDAHNAVFAVAK
jgi:hypothetical protein